MCLQLNKNMLLNITKCYSIINHHYYMMEMYEGKLIIELEGIFWVYYEMYLHTNNSLTETFIISYNFMSLC